MTGIFRRGRIFWLCIFALVLPVVLVGQPGRVQGRVTDAAGKPVAGAEVRDGAGHLLATTSDAGEFAIPSGVSKVLVSDPHFVTVTVAITGPLYDGKMPAPLNVVLDRPLETVTVTAYRSPLASMDSPASTRVLTTQELAQSTTPALDGKLREVPGFELFRRSSSLVANPTTEGVSLRGLGSTAASRSLVVFDDVPMNDPYGGWIHWEELPPMAIKSVEVVRGGASDLYGSSAIGGVISVVPVRPQSNTFQIDTSYGSLETSSNAAMGSFRAGRWAGLETAGVLATDGYTLIAPNLRGPVDQPSNVHAQNGLAEIDYRIGPADADNTHRVFLRGDVENEARHNGTILTTNGTRLWRYVAGADVSGLTLRFYGDNEHYRQNFSSIATGRATETLTRYAEDPATELGAVAHWHHVVTQRLLVLAGADTHDVRASDDETLLTTHGLLNTTARQRQTGVYGEALYTPRSWTLSGSARVDHFSNFDALQYTSPTKSTALPSFSETVFDPRLGLTRRLTSSLALSASGFRAYRAPTENELYRTGQVGQQITQPNSNLRSERATGWETGVQADLSRIASTVRVSYFWTQVNRPITALTLSMTPTSTTLKRENLGQIESRGVSLDYALQPARWIAIEGGYQYAIATVTKYAQQPQLVNNWIPQVARNMATAQVRLSHPKLGLLSLQERASGHQFDDDANQYLLHSYFRFDAYASRKAGRHVEIYASGENLFDRNIEVGKTPVLTLGTPRTARVGLRLNWGE
jgi:outer membrane receptor protein involved in Fe transport